MAHYTFFRLVNPELLLIGCVRTLTSPFTKYTSIVLIVRFSYYIILPLPTSYAYMATEWLVTCNGTGISFGGLVEIKGRVWTCIGDFDVIHTRMKIKALKAQWKMDRTCQTRLSLVFFLKIFICVLKIFWGLATGESGQAGLSTRPKKELPPIN